MKYFIDTNIFIYSFDSSSALKQKKAKALIYQALSDRLGVTSIQVVQEFFNVALRKFRIPLNTSDAKYYLESVLKPLCEVYSDLELIKEALSLQERFKTSWFDSIIIASALTAGCTTLYSEDFQSGQKIAGVTIVNPF